MENNEIDDQKNRINNDFTNNFLQSRLNKIDQLYLEIETLELTELTEREIALIQLCREYHKIYKL